MSGSVSHKDVKKNLAEYLEGEIALEDRERVDAHLETCEECAREVAEMQQTIRLLRMLPEPETPPMIAANVMRRVRAGESRPNFLARFLSGLKSIFEPSFVLPASAIAAAALVVVVLQDPSRVALPDILNPLASPLTSPLTSPSMDARAVPASAAGPEALRNAGLETMVPRSLSSTARPGANTRSQEPMRRRQLADRSARSQADPRLTGRAARRAAPTSIASRGANRLQGEASGASRTTVYADPMLVSSTPRTPRTPRNTVPDVYVSNGSGPMPPATFVMDRYGVDARDAGRARAVAQARTQVQEQAAVRGRTANDLRFSIADTVRSGISSGGEDPRDAWLAKGLSDPIGFSHFIAAQNLAEQELWVARLAARAESRGLLSELTESLRRTGDETAAWLAKDFEAEVEPSRGDTEGVAVPGLR